MVWTLWVLRHFLDLLLLESKLSQRWQVNHCSFRTQTTLWQKHRATSRVLTSIATAKLRSTLSLLRAPASLKNLLCTCRALRSHLWRQHSVVIVYVSSKTHVLLCTISKVLESNQQWIVFECNEVKRCFCLMMPKPLAVEQGQRREGRGVKACFQMNTDNSPLKFSSWWEIRHQQVLLLFCSNY